MGLSSASRQMLRGMISIPKKINRHLKRNKQLNVLAGRAMDKKYPAGWAQSPTNMAEMKQMKKKIYKGIGR